MRKTRPTRLPNADVYRTFDDVHRPAANLIVDASYIFTKDANATQLYTSDK